MKIRHRMVIVNDEKSTYQRAKKPLPFRWQTVNTLHVWIVRANRLNSNNTTILKFNNKKLLFKFICSASVKFNARMVSSSVYKRFWVFIRNVLSHDALRCVILFHSLTKSGICSHWLFVSLFHVFDFILFVVGFWKWKNEQKKNENINRNIVTCKC